MATKYPFIAKHGLQVGNTATGGSFTFPTSDGTSSQVMVTDGSGTLSWATQSGGISDLTGESIKDLLNVYSSMSPTDGQVLTYDTTNGWQAETLSGGGGASNGPGIEFTASSSDPLTTTNPSSNGALWYNSTDDKIFVCVDATTDSNEWWALTGLELTVEPFKVQGETYGYSLGGSPDATLVNRYPFTSDGNASDVANLSQGALYASGSLVDKSGGYVWTAGTSGATNGRKGNQLSVASNAVTLYPTCLVQPRYSIAAASDEAYGYAAGGYTAPAAPYGPVATYGWTDIDRFSFASGNDGSNIGDLGTATWQQSSQQSATHGYACYAPQNSTIMQKYPFTSSTTTTDIGNLYSGKYGAAGTNSETYGYHSGGYLPTYSNMIQKFPFASDTDGSASVGSLIFSGRYFGASSSFTYGYVHGGTTSNAPGRRNYIQKHPFTSDTNASDVGDLTVTQYYNMGSQY